MHLTILMFFNRCDSFHPADCYARTTENSHARSSRFVDQMKIEYLSEGSLDCPLIRIFDFSTEEAKALIGVVRNLGNAPNGTVAVHELPQVESVRNITLVFKTGEHNHGCNGAPPDFECELTQTGWSNVEGLLEPFAASPSSGRYQWLDESGDVALLISPQGGW